MTLITEQHCGKPMRKESEPQEKQKSMHSTNTNYTFQA